MFDADEFIRAVDQVRDHVSGRRKITLRTLNVGVPRVDKIGARQIRSIAPASMSARRCLLGC